MFTLTMVSLGFGQTPSCTTETGEPISIANQTYCYQERVILSAVLPSGYIPSGLWTICSNGNTINPNNVITITPPVGSTTSICYIARDSATTCILEGQFEFTVIEACASAGTCIARGGTLTGNAFTFCVGDDLADNIPSGSLNISNNVGTNTQWVLTDASGIIVDLPTDITNVNFDGAGIGTCFIRVVSYETITGLTIGQAINSVRGCVAFSNAVEVTRVNCATPCRAEGGVLEGGPFTFCVGDGIADKIGANELHLSGNTQNDQWIITDINGVIVDLPVSYTAIDFDAAEVGTCFLFHLGYETGLIGLQVGNRIGSLTGCFGLSNVIQINRITCVCEPLPACNTTPICDGQGNLTVEELDPVTCNCVQVPAREIFCRTAPDCTNGLDAITKEVYDATTCSCVTITVPPPCNTKKYTCDGTILMQPDFDTKACLCFDRPVEEGCVDFQPTDLCPIGIVVLGHNPTWIPTRSLVMDSLITLAFERGYCAANIGVVIEQDLEFCNTREVLYKVSYSDRCQTDHTCSFTYKWTTGVLPICDTSVLCDGTGRLTSQLYDEDLCECITIPVPLPICNSTLVCDGTGQLTKQIYDVATCSCKTETVTCPSPVLTGSTIVDLGCAPRDRNADGVPDLLEGVVGGVAASSSESFVLDAIRWEDELVQIDGCLRTLVRKYIVTNNCGQLNNDTTDSFTTDKPTQSKIKQ